MAGFLMPLTTEKGVTPASSWSMHAHQSGGAGVMHSRKHAQQLASAMSKYFMKA